MENYNDPQYGFGVFFLKIQRQMVFENHFTLELQNY